MLARPHDAGLIEELKEIREDFDRKEEDYLNIIKELRSSLDRENPNTTIAMNEVIKLAEEVEEENREIKRLKADTEENYKRIIDDLTDQLHGAQIQLVQMNSQSLDIRVIEELRSEFTKKEEQYINTIKEIKKSLSAGSPSKNLISGEIASLAADLDKSNRENHRLKAELRSAEELYKTLQEQN